ncbi:MAG: cyclase family protein [Planctomycetota bacterium]
MIIHDISPPVAPGRLAVFPGDTPPTRDVLLDVAHGDPVTLSTLRTTVHVGAHVDAPSHYGAGAPTIDERPLDVYVGPCEVIDVPARPGALIGPDDLPGPVAAERVLLRTGTYPDPAVFNDDFAALEPALVDALHEQGVRLVGVDTPSVDPADSKDLPAHHRFLARDMTILEGVVLAGIAPGRYELIALPLRLVGFDASPVRAVLRAEG